MLSEWRLARTATRNAMALALLATTMLLGSTEPALAASRVFLYPGQELTIPTWCSPGTTNVVFLNYFEIDVPVSIQAGLAAPEELTVPRSPMSLPGLPGQPPIPIPGELQIGRGWACQPAHITNRGDRILLVSYW